MDSARKELLAYLESGHAHVPLLDAAKDFPEKLMNQKIGGIPFTPWALLEHIHIAQKDMVDFMQDPNYKELDWPKEYWPSPSAKATAAMWRKTLREYEKGLETVKLIVKNPKTNLFAPIPRGTGQTIAKEILQIIDHTAYHTGELVMMRRALGAWRN